MGVKGTAAGLLYGGTVIWILTWLIAGALVGAVFMAVGILFAAVAVVWYLIQLGDVLLAPNHDDLRLIAHPFVGAAIAGIVALGVIYGPIPDLEGIIGLVDRVPQDNLLLILVVWLSSVLWTLISPVVAAVGPFASLAAAASGVRKRRNATPYDVAFEDPKDDLWFLIAATALWGIPLGWWIGSAALA